MMPPTTSDLPTIPVFDVGPDFPIEVARKFGERGYDLLHAATKGIPRLVLLALDRLSRAWLVRNHSPYLAEIDTLAAQSRFPGLYYLNVSYEWGCTTAARPSPDGTTAILQRTLDWEVAGIGRFVAAARVQSARGPWISLTWPGFTGVVQGMAPGRFAAAIDQPPPPRRTGLFAIDAILAKTSVWSSEEAQPIHLLRRVFETAPDYAAARRMLETTPITTPVIFTLAGITAAETCVIERRPYDARVLDDAIAANEWRSPDWRAGHHHAFENARRLQTMRRASPALDPRLDWLAYPVLNEDTRLAMMAEPATARLIARGYEKGRAATAVLDIRG